MTKTTISFEADQFLAAMRGRSFAYVGAAMLIRAHLTMAPDNRIERAGVHAIFNSRSASVIVLINDVLDLSFREDDKGLIFSPSVDRAVAAAS